MEKKNHLVAADVLRGVAILMVVLYHSFGPIYGYYLPWKGMFRDFQAPPSHIFFLFYPISFGWAGVALFFVLSGFCIHLSFLRSRSFSVSQFFWNRFWRIVPAYYAALLFFTIHDHVDVSSFTGAKLLITHLLFIHNFFSQEIFFGINPAFWSIATEVQLYFLFPVILLIRKRLGIEGCLLITLATGCLWRLGVTGACLHYGVGFPDNVANSQFSSAFMTWFDWTLGAFVAERYYAKKAAFTFHIRWVILLVTLLVISSLYKPLTIFSFTLAASISAVVLDNLLHLSYTQLSIMILMLVKLLRFVGLISYSLYLWHQPFLFTVSNHFPWLSPVASISITTILLGGCSYLSYCTLELGGIYLGSKLNETRNMSTP